MRKRYSPRLVGTVQIRAGDDVFARWGNAVGAIGEGETAKVMARALNRTGMPLATQVRRALVKQTSAPLALVKRQVVVKKAWGGGLTPKLEFQIVATGRRIALKYFHPRQFAYGVRAKVWGRWQRYEGMFGAPGDNPRVIAGLGGFSGHVVHRLTTSRLPLGIAWGPSLPIELVTGVTAETFKGGTFRLAADLEHELARVLPK